MKCAFEKSSRWDESLTTEKIKDCRWVTPDLVCQVALEALQSLVRLDRLTAARNRAGWDGNALSGIAEQEYPVAVGGRADQLSPLGPDPQLGYRLGSLYRDVSGRSSALDTRFFFATLLAFDLVVLVERGRLSK
jgi:hypothetical protein